MKQNQKDRNILLGKYFGPVKKMKQICIALINNADIIWDVLQMRRILCVCVSVCCPRFPVY